MARDDDTPDDEKDYEVGYGRPPKHTRFPKGQSGNPKGRRKGSRGLKTDLDEALKETLTITVGGKKLRGTTQALSTYTLALKSATGDLRYQKHLHGLTLNLFGPGDRGGSEEKLSKHDEELLERLLQRFESDEVNVSTEASPDSQSDGQAPASDEEGDSDQ